MRQLYINDPICPICGISLEDIDVYSEDIDDDTIIRTIDAECPECHRAYMYDKYYSYAGYRELREDD